MSPIDQLAEIVATYQELGIGGILVVVIIFTGRYLMRQNRECYEDYKKHVDEHKEELKEISHKLFKVVEDNSQAMLSLKQTVDILFIAKMHENGNVIKTREH